MAWEAKFYVRQFGLVQKDLGGYLMVSAFAYDCGALLFGDLAARRSRSESHDGTPPRLLFGIATALAAIGFSALSEAASPRTAMILIALSGIGRGALVTLLNSDMAARAPRAAVSAAAGIIASAQALVHFLVNPAIGYAVQASGYRVLLITLGAWAIPGSLAWMLWNPGGDDSMQQEGAKARRSLARRDRRSINGFQS
jgi:MFS family permease